MFRYCLSFQLMTLCPTRVRRGDRYSHGERGMRPANIDRQDGARVFAWQETGVSTATNSRFSSMTRSSIRSGHPRNPFRTVGARLGRSGQSRNAWTGLATIGQTSPRFRSEARRTDRHLEPVRSIGGCRRRRASRVRESCDACANRLDRYPTH